LLIVAEKLPERPGGSYSIEKWFSGDQGTKSNDFNVKPEAAKTLGGHSGGIWGDFDDCDSVPDAVLLTVADAVERREIKMEQSKHDGELYFPGQGQKLSEVTNTSVPLRSIVRRIPGVGVISSHSVNDRSQTKPTLNAATATSNMPQRQSFSDMSSFTGLIPKSDNAIGNCSRSMNDRSRDKPALNVATTTSNLSQRQSFSDMSSFAGLIPKSDNTIGNRRASSASPVKYKSVADFRKTVGMVLSPPGTEIRVQNFMSVCNRNARPFLSRNDPHCASGVKSVRSVSDDDTNMATRPLKKMRSDAVDTLLVSKIAVSADSKKSPTQPNNLALQLDRSVSIAGDDDGVVMVNSDSENDGVLDSEQSWQNVEINAYNHKTPSTARGILPLAASSVDEGETSHIDQAVGGVGSSQTSCVECPVCQIPIPADIINEHLDQCLR